MKMNGFGTGVRRTSPSGVLPGVLTGVLVGVAVAGGALVGGSVFSGAYAATTSASTNCVVSTGSARSTSARFDFDLAAPAEIDPGDRLDITATMTVSFPDEFRRAVYSPLANAQLQIAEMAAQAMVGGERFTFPISFTTPKRRLDGQAMVYTARVKVADLEVPRDASGAVTVAIAGNDYAVNRAGGSPARVAIDGRIIVDGFGTSRRIGCSFPQSPPELARVAVSAPPSPEPTPGDGGSGGDGADDGDGTGGTGTTPGDGSGGAGTGGVGSGDPGTGTDGTGGTGGEGGLGGGGLGAGSPGGFFAPGPGNSPRPSLDFLNEPQGVFGTTPPGGSAVPPTSASPSPDASGRPGGEPLASGDTAFVDLPPQTRTGAGWPSWQMSLLLGLIVAAGAGALLWTRVRLGVLRRRAE